MIRVRAIRPSDPDVHRARRIDGNAEVRRHSALVAKVRNAVWVGNNSTARNAKAGNTVAAVALVTAFEHGQVAQCTERVLARSGALVARNYDVVDDQGIFVVGWQGTVDQRIDNARRMCRDAHRVVAAGVRDVPVFYRREDRVGVWLTTRVP